MKREISCEGFILEKVLERMWNFRSFFFSAISIGLEDKFFWNVVLKRVLFLGSLVYVFFKDLECLD